MEFRHCIPLGAYLTPCYENVTFLDGTLALPDYVITMM
jgi:hypothetical protein